MQAVWHLAIKDLRVLSRDKMSLFFILGFPIVMGLFFGTIMGGPSSGGSSAKVRIAIVDEDDTDISRKFVENLTDVDSVQLTSRMREQAMDEVRKGKITGMIALPKGFGETAGIPWEGSPTIELGMDPSRAAESAMVEGFVMQAMGQLFGDRLFNPDAARPFLEDLRVNLDNATSDIPENMRPAFSGLVDSLDDVYDSIDQQVGDEASDADAVKSESNAAGDLQFANIEKIDVTRVLEKGTQSELLSRVRSKWDIAFPQATVWGILGCVAGFSVSVVRERVRGTLDRLETAPIRRVHILIGKGLACFLAVSFVVIMMVGLGYFLGLRPRSVPLLVLATAFVAFCFVGIMLTVSVLGKTEEAVGGTGWAINMAMAMLGGGMIPLMFLPSFIQPLSHFSPVKWAVLAMEGAIWRGFSLSEMFLPLGILFAVGLAGITIGAWRFRQS